MILLVTGSFVRLGGHRTSTVQNNIRHNLNDRSHRDNGDRPRQWRRDLRPPTRARHALPHGDVGAFHLLRDARDPRSCSSSAPRRTAASRMDDKTSSAIYGLYISGTYLLSLYGGWVADRLIGAQRAVWWGGILIMVGNGLLALGSTQLFFLGVVLIAFGVGLLKPNISAIVAQIYPEGGSRRDARLLDLLHGHQRRRVPGLDDRADPRGLATAGAGDLRRRPSAWRSVSCSSR